MYIRQDKTAKRNISNKEERPTQIQPHMLMMSPQKVEATPVEKVKPQTKANITQNNQKLELPRLIMLILWNPLNPLNPLNLLNP